MNEVVIVTDRQDIAVDHRSGMEHESAGWIIFVAVDHLLFYTKIGQVQRSAQ